MTAGAIICNTRVIKDGGFKGATRYMTDITILLQPIHHRYRHVWGCGIINLAGRNHTIMAGITALTDHLGTIVIWHGISEIRGVMAITTIGRGVRMWWRWCLAPRPDGDILRAAIVARSTVTGDPRVREDAHTKGKPARYRVDVAEMAVLCGRQVSRRIFHHGRCLRSGEVLCFMTAFAAIR